MKICFFGAYDSDYSRNQIIKKGLLKNNIEVIECYTSSHYKFWLRYSILLVKYLKYWKENDYFFVPAFRHKDVPLAKFLSLITHKPLFFDPLISRYETKIVDWEKAGKNSFQAWWNKKIDWTAFKFSDLIFADTSSHANYYSREFKIDRRKFRLLPVGADEEIFAPGNNSVEKDFFLVQFYGSYVPLQGIEYIVQAAKMVEKKDKSIKFELIGSGQTYPKIKDLVYRFKLNNVELKDWVAYRELPGTISRADICLGIFGKGAKAKRVVPNKVYQTMAMRKPVITGRTPTILEFFEHKKNIFLCEVGSGNSLAQAILELRNDENLCQKIAQNGWQTVRKKFNTASLGKQLKEIIKWK